MYKSPTRLFSKKVFPSRLLVGRGRSKEMRNKVSLFPPTLGFTNVAYNKKSGRFNYFKWRN